jgi:hypothetical protein
MTANATGLPVAAGPVEATVIGNVSVQAIAAGQFPSLGEVRRYISAKLPSNQFVPQVSSSLENAKARFAEIEARYA